jgi:hypothetical protein
MKRRFHEARVTSHESRVTDFLMPRATVNNNNSIFFRGALITPAEKILRIIENARDSYTLMEMNGEKCAGRQISKLRWYDRPARQSNAER